MPTCAFFPRRVRKAALHSGRGRHFVSISHRFDVGKIDRWEMKASYIIFWAVVLVAMGGCSDRGHDLQVRVDLPPGTTMENAESVAEPLVNQAASGLCREAVTVPVTRFEVEAHASGEQKVLRAVGRFRCP